MNGIIPSQFPLENPGEQILPDLACSWFCHPAITNACLGNPSAFSPGNDQAPVLYLNSSSAKEGEIILFQCAIDWQFPATRVVFCKNGLEEFSLKAQQGKVIYALVLNITSRSAGTYTCGYQQRNESNWVRNSALSAPQTLSVPGAGAGETTTDIHSSTGACRGRCPRQQHVDSPQTEDTNYGDIQYSTIAHVQRDRPRPAQQMRNTTTYATVTQHPDPIVLSQGKGTGALSTAAFALLQRTLGALLSSQGFVVTGKGCECLAKTM
nr:uncharacterized protein LOC119715459 [Anas platyrhynchos]